MSDVEVVTLGEVMVALVATEPGPLEEVQAFSPCAAGAEANLAIGLARLGHRAALIGRLGDDGLGRSVLRRLRGEGVEVRHLRLDPAHPTGVVIRERRGFGPSQVVYWRAGSAASRLGPDDVSAAEELFRSASWLHLTGITPALSASCRQALEAALSLAERHQTAVSFAVNLRRKLWPMEEACSAVRTWLPRCRLVFASQEEAGLLTGESGPERQALALLRLGVGTAVVTRGRLGALAASAEGCWERPAHPVPAVDVVGAGDAFAAGYLAATLEGQGVPAALELANLCGAFAVSSRGDAIGLPTRAEVAATLSGADLIR